MPRGEKTAVDYRFYTKEQQDFYETVLFDKSPAVSDMRYVDWKFIKENEDYFPSVQDNFHCIGLDEFVGREFTAWNDEMMMRRMDHLSGQISHCASSRLEALFISSCYCHLSSCSISLCSSCCHTNSIHDICRDLR